MFSCRNFIAKVTKATTRSKYESVAKFSKLKMRVSVYPNLEKLTNLDIIFFSDRMVQLRAMTN